MRTNKQLLILYITIIGSIVIALFTAKYVHVAIKNMEITSTSLIIIAGVIIGGRFFVRVGRYVRKVISVMRFIKRHKIN